MVYYDTLDDAALHAAHARFIVIVKDLDQEQRHAILRAGAIHVFRQDDTENLSLVLSNYRWSSLPKRHLRLGQRLCRRPVAPAPAVWRHRLRTDPDQCQFLSILRDQARTRPGQPVPLTQINLALWGFADTPPRRCAATSANCGPKSKSTPKSPASC